MGLVAGLDPELHRPDLERRWGKTMRVEFTPFRAAAMIVLVMVGSGTAARAASVVVPNFSFESPATTAELVTSNWVQVGVPTTTNDVYNPYQNQGGNAFYTGANPSTDPALG